MLETRQPTGVSSELSYTKEAPLGPQVARTLDDFEEASDEGERLPPPVGSVEGLPEEGAEGLSVDGGVEGLSVGEGLEGVAESGVEPGVLVGGSAGVTGVSPVGAGAGEGLGASVGEGLEVGGTESGDVGVSTPLGGVMGGVPVGVSPVGAPV
jgi:hypothetical protein